MQYVYNDGGREAAGFKGTTGDCFIRAVAIVTQRPYREVYKEVAGFCKAENRRRRRSGPRTGVFVVTAQAYFASKGWTWTPTMFIGSGCTVHMRARELPKGRIICSVPKHYAAVIDGVLHDNHDCSRSGRRCVYGYWSPPT